MATNKSKSGANKSGANKSGASKGGAGKGGAGKGGAGKGGANKGVVLTTPQEARAWIVAQEAQGVAIGRAVVATFADGAPTLDTIAQAIGIDMARSNRAAVQSVVTIVRSAARAAGLTLPNLHAVGRGRRRIAMTF